MVAAYAALGLFNVSAPLDPRAMPGATDPEWVASRMVPFSSRMVTERLACAPMRAWEHGVASGTYVRILVNDEVQPLEFCGGGEERMCALDAFVESQAYARNDGEGDWEKCFE